MDANAQACAHCGGPIARRPDRGFSGQYCDARFGEGRPARVHAECADAWRGRHAPQCGQCGRVIVAPRYLTVPASAAEGASTSVALHEECAGAWRAARAPRCEQCGEPIGRSLGGRSGRCAGIPGGGKLHAECVDAWRAAQRRGAGRGGK